MDSNTIMDAPAVEEPKPEKKSTPRRPDGTIKSKNTAAQAADKLSPKQRRNLGRALASAGKTSKKKVVKKAKGKKAANTSNPMAASGAKFSTAARNKSGPSLRDAVTALLKKQGPMTVGAIAELVNEKKLYKRPNGKPVTGGIVAFMAIREQDAGRMFYGKGDVATLVGLKAGK